MALRAGAKAKMPKEVFEKELKRLQRELVIQQQYMIDTGQRVVVIFEGRDAAGKGGVIKTHHASASTRAQHARGRARHARPSARRRSGTSSATSSICPPAGEMVLFDRSWYNRAGVERVMGFCTDEEYKEFLRSAPGVRADARALRDPPDQVLVLGQPDDEQESVSRPASNDPMRAVEAQPDGRRVARRAGSSTRRRRTRCSPYCDIKQAPWWVVEADDKRRARLNCITPSAEPDPVRGPDAREDRAAAAPDISGYVRPPMDDQTFVPEMKYWPRRRWAPMRRVRGIGRHESGSWSMYVGHLVGDRRAVDLEHVLGVHLAAAREVERADECDVVGDGDLRVHVVVDAARRIRR